MQKQVVLSPPKKSFSIALCVFCSIHVIFSTLTACKTTNFHFFSFLFCIHIKAEQELSSKGKKSGVASYEKKFLYCKVKTAFLGVTVTSDRQPKKKTA